MSNFWMALLAAQTAAADTKPASRHQQILSVVCGIALALLIGAGLFIAAALTTDISDKRARTRCVAGPAYDRQLPRYPAYLRRID
jgi:hypothetical protein